MGTMPWGAMTENLAGRWSFADGIKYQNQRYSEMLSVGESMQVGDELITGKGKSKPMAQNCFDFAEKRQELLARKDEWRVC